jgi:hypothetical protein
MIDRMRKSSEQRQHSEVRGLAVDVEARPTSGEEMDLSGQRADQFEMVDQGEGIEHPIPVCIVIALAAREEQTQQPAGVKITEQLLEAAGERRTHTINVVIGDEYSTPRHAKEFLNGQLRLGQVMEYTESGATVERAIREGQCGGITRQQKLRRNSGRYRSLPHLGNGFNAENLEVW